MCGDLVHMRLHIGLNGFHQLPLTAAAIHYARYHACLRLSIQFCQHHSYLTEVHNP